MSVLMLKGVLSGHGGWVTSLTTNAAYPNILVSSSRDRRVMVWEITGDSEVFGFAKKSLTGHNGFVSDVKFSVDGQYVISSSWDGTLRLWNLTTGTTVVRFVGHSRDVMSADISGDNRLIVSGARDSSIKIWNTIGVCKYTIDSEMGGHTDWISEVKFVPNTDLLISASWDNTIKIWNCRNFQLKSTHLGHSGYINCVATSPDSSLFASAGRDGKVLIWDVVEACHLCTLESNEEVTSMEFCPNRMWLCAASGKSIMVWDLKEKVLLGQIQVEPVGSNQIPSVISLAWSKDAQTLFAGYTDNKIRAYGISI